MNQVKAEVDRLAREKVDTAALEHYTTRVTRLFEQVRGRLPSGDAGPMQPGPGSEAGLLRVSSDDPRAPGGGHVDR